MKGLGKFNLEQSVLKELSNVKLAMHIDYMTERFNKINEIEFDGKLPLDNDSYEILNIPSKTQKEFKSIFRQLMKDKILEAQTEFLKREDCIFTSNIKEAME
ncbi:hypothetical protein [Staphylococcus simulans]